MRYSNVVSGFGVVFALIFAIVAITAFQVGWRSLDERPANLDRRISSLGASGPSSAPPATSVAVPASPPPPAAAAAAAEERPAATSAVPAAGVANKAVPVAQGPRFAVEFGPFLTGTEVEKTERRVNEAGYQTVRFRQRTGAALYAVLVEGVSGHREANALLTTLREQGFPDPVVLETSQALNVRVGDPLLLRAAVQLAENLRAKGHPIRVATQPGEAQTFVLRHGNFVSRDEAEARGGELARLGLPNHVVRAK